MDSKQDSAGAGKSAAASLPNHLYYRGCAGDWRSVISIAITDPVALRNSGMGFFDRLGLRMTAFWPRWLGRFFLHTTVTYDEGGDVVHTTEARWLGIAIRRSTETIALDADGRRFTMRGGTVGSGTVDETATRAAYDLVWLGARIRQRTVREPDVVRVEQEGPGFRGAHELLRRR